MYGALELAERIMGARAANSSRPLRELMLDVATQADGVRGAAWSGGAAITPNAPGCAAAYSACCARRASRRSTSPCTCSGVGFASPPASANTTSSRRTAGSNGAGWPFAARSAAMAAGPAARTYTARHYFSCVGYYDYDGGHRPTFPGEARFGGKIIHPQDWPRTDGADGATARAPPDYAGKRVVVVGSGATAVTLAPVMARDAASLVVLQRTPSFIAGMPMHLAPWRATRALAWLARRGVIHADLKPENVAFVLPAEEEDGEEDLMGDQSWAKTDDFSGGMDALMDDLMDGKTVEEMKAEQAAAGLRGRTRLKGKKKPRGSVRTSA